MQILLPNEFINQMLKIYSDREVNLLAFLSITMTLLCQVLRMYEHLKSEVQAERYAEFRLELIIKSQPE